MGIKSSKHLLKKCRKFLILADMELDNDIYCMNMSHQSIILDYLSQIQALMDKITLEDEDYEEFLSILATMIEMHNEQGSYAYKDVFYRQKWFYSLPNMVYWACMGYMCGIETKHLKMEVVILKLSKILVKTIKRLDKMALINPGFDNDETILN